jgi:hypothetical protein
LGRLASPADADALGALADGYPEESTRRTLVQAHTRSQNVTGE